MDPWLLTTVILWIGFVVMTFLFWRESKAVDRTFWCWLEYIRDRNNRQRKEK